MAFAPYFGKAALGAAALMQGVGLDALRQLIQPLRVTVAFCDDSVASPEGRLLLELTTNLLARFYPVVEFASQGAGATSHAAQLRDQARTINPAIEFASGPTEHTACICVGRVTGTPAAAFCVYLGSDDWVAHVSTRFARPVGSSHNPFGAGAAACIGSAFVFRHFFHNLLGVPHPDEDRTLSLATYDVDGTDSGGPNLRTDLGKFAMVGIGAIGNAAIWALRHTGCHGQPYLIDSEVVDDTNPQRYVLTSAASPSMRKVDLAEQYLAGSALTPTPVFGKWATFASSHEFDLPFLVACALDTAADRIGVQASLPEFILNAWTQRGDLGVSRHTFLGDDACLACLYWPRTKRQNQDELVKQAIRYSGDLMDVRNMIYLHTPIDDLWVARIAKDMGVDPSVIAPFRGSTLDAFYREAICGGHVIATNGTSVEVPMAFQSAMAGIMLAAEIVKMAALRRVRDGLVTTKLDLLRPIGKRLSEQAKKPSNIRCICGDKTYTARYRAKYPSQVRGQQGAKDCETDDSVPENCEIAPDQGNVRGHNQ